MAKSTKVTIANPQLAPYGNSAKAYLQAQNSYETMKTQKRLIQAENIALLFNIRIPVVSIMALLRWHSCQLSKQSLRSFIP